MKKFTSIQLMRFIVAVTALVLGVSFYLQYVKDLEPCPLCLMQRLCIFFIFLFSVMNLLTRVQTRRKKWMIAQLMMAFCGIYFASRQLWLYSLPKESIPACVPGLAILMHYFPVSELLKALFWGSGDCTEITWKFLGLSLPTWSLLYFMFIGAVTPVLHRKLHHDSTSDR